MVDISIRGELWDDDSADVLRWWGFRDITAPMDIRTASLPSRGAWIEIRARLALSLDRAVAPLTGSVD